MSHTKLWELHNLAKYFIQQCTQCVSRDEAHYKHFAPSCFPKQSSEIQINIPRNRYFPDVIYLWFYCDCEIIQIMGINSVFRLFCVTLGMLDLSLMLPIGSCFESVHLRKILKKLSSTYVKQPAGHLVVNPVHLNPVFRSCKMLCFFNMSSQAHFFWSLTQQMLLARGHLFVDRKSSTFCCSSL